MTSIDPNLLFFGNLVDSSSKIEGLEKFLEHVDGFIARETKYYEEDAHVDLEMEFLPLFAETFPPILHSSLIISTAILLEQEMRGYSTALLDAIRSDLKFNDLSGSVLERFLSVISKVAKLPVDHGQLMWDDVVGLFEIRNCLVHAGGNLVGFQRAAAIKAFSARNGTPNFADDSLLVDSATSQFVLKVAMSFLEGIYDLALERFPGHYKPRFVSNAPSIIPTATAR